MGIGILSEFGYGVKGVLEVNCGCANTYIIDFRGVLDNTRSTFCVKAMMYTVWLSLS